MGDGECTFVPQANINMFYALLFTPTIGPPVEQAVTAELISCIIGEQTRRILGMGQRIR